MLRRFSILIVLLVGLLFIATWTIVGQQRTPAPYEKNWTAQTHFNRGALFIDLGNFEAAIADYTHAIELDPEFATAYNNRSYAFNAVGEYNKALSDCSRVIELDPDSVAAHFNCGNANLALGKYNEAIGNYDYVLKSSPDNGAVYFSRGFAHQELGHHQQANRDYTRSIELDPECQNQCQIDYNNRGNTFVDIGDYDAAMTDFNRALEMDPNFAGAFLNRARTYYELGDLDYALADANQALELDRKYAEAHCILGLVYRRQGERTKAQLQLKLCEFLMGGTVPEYVRNSIAGLEPTPRQRTQALEMVNCAVGVLIALSAVDLIYSYIRRRNTTNSDPTKSANRERGGCFTFLLIVIFIGGMRGILTYFNSTDWARSVQLFMPWIDDTTWIPLIIGIYGMITIISVIGLWKWHRWGFYLLISGAVFYGVSTLLVGFPILWSLIGITEIDLVWMRVRKKWVHFT